MSDVAHLLEQARAAHQRYRDSLPRRITAPGGKTVAVPGDAMAANDALNQACRFRSEAHVLDPARADHAWQDEPSSDLHNALLDFYVHQLTR